MINWIQLNCNLDGSVGDFVGAPAGDFVGSNEAQKSTFGARKLFDSELRLASKIKLRNRWKRQQNH